MASAPRSSGVLMPVPALPGPGVIGDLGPAAVAFADFLAASGHAVWQVLPLAVTTAVAGNSPYNSLSAFALDPLLVSPERLSVLGWLSPAEIASACPGRRLRYGEARRLKARLLALAWRRFRRDPAARRELARFREREAWWLADFALFRVLRRGCGGRPWTEWPRGLRERDPGELRRATRELAPALERQGFGQYLAHRQWRDLRDELAARGLEVMGDLPFYVAHDSADVWSHPELFALDVEGRPEALAGCPPDAFTAEGQLWGQPVYRWAAHRDQGFAWWLARSERQAALFDRLRLDHFRGLAATWQVPAGAGTAAAGSWVEAPGGELVDLLRGRLPAARWVAEDLGVLSPEVHALRRRLGAAGTRVLQFAFGEDFPASEHLPERAPADVVLYSGTHDNDTLRGWLESGAGAAERERLASYLGSELEPERAVEELLRRCLASPADLVILPMADVLGLGSRARINRPGRSRGQWSWRLASDQLGPEPAADWRRRLADSGRLGGRDGGR
ncbi:MAG: 4-alpha-glucanotransferase [Thermoanaerobaculia bacterium]